MDNRFRILWDWYDFLIRIQVCYYRKNDQNEPTAETQWRLYPAPSPTLRITGLKLPLPYLPFDPIYLTPGVKLKISATYVTYHLHYR